MPHTILLIDDDPLHLRIQSRLVADAGFRPVTVVVGANSFGLPENESPGLIYLDYRLNSSITSAQLAGLLRETYKEVPIILVSSMPEMPEEMAPLVDGFIGKSDPDELVRFTKQFFDDRDKASAAIACSS
jgi:DNA-binding NtrC family response regulator